MLFFSIVIPVHNRAHTLKKCVDSILSQSYKDFELLLVDDHSTDSSLQMCNEYAASDTRIKVFSQSDEKQGAQAARNLGIKNAMYDWVMFNDSDDVWHKDKIQKELAVLEQYGFDERLVIYSDCNTINVDTNAKAYWALPHIDEQNSYKDLLVQSGPMFQSLLCSKKHLVDIGCLDESVPSYQEWDTSIRLAKEGRFVHVKDALFDYYIGANDAISKSMEKDFIGRCNIYNKFKDEIIRMHGLEQYKKMLACNFYTSDNKMYFEKLRKTNSIISLYESNLIECFGSRYENRMAKFSQDSFIKKVFIKTKTIIKLCVRVPFSIASKIVSRHRALKTKTPIIITPIQDRNSKQYLYQLSFFAEFSQYFNSKLASLYGGFGRKKMFYDLNFAFFPIQYSFDDYFSSCIKSSERALIRKAMKNGYVCREIDYDNYLKDVLLINTSKASRQGGEMSSDYIGDLKPRQKIVSSVGQKVFTFGCFDANNYLVAYYMFELYGKNILHTVKGIGHSEHLSFGIMNYLFAFSEGELFKKFTDGTFCILYGGMDENGGGLSRFKRNVGCKMGSPAISAGWKFYRDLKKFNKKYKIHGDTGLNFILDYM